MTKVDSYLNFIFNQNKDNKTPKAHFLLQTQLPGVQPHSAGLPWQLVLGSTGAGALSAEPEHPPPEHFLSELLCSWPRMETHGPSQFNF